MRTKAATTVELALTVGLVGILGVALTTNVKVADAAGKAAQARGPTSRAF